MNRNKNTSSSVDDFIDRNIHKCYKFMLFTHSLGCVSY